jgi:hypothetical protein
MRARRGGRGAPLAGPPPLLPGQVVQVAKSVATDVAEQSMAAGGEAAAPASEEKGAEETTGRGRSRGRRGRGRAGKEAKEQPSAQQQPAAEAVQEPSEAVEAPVEQTQPVPEEKVAAAARSRRGRGRGRASAGDEAPPILPGQAVSAPAATRQVAKKAGRRKAAAEQPEQAEQTAQTAAETAPETATPAKKRSRGRSRSKKATVTETAAAPAAFSAAALGLPEGNAAITDYLSTSYKGIGKKTAESLLEAFGGELFRVMEEQPQRVREVLGDKRASGLLDQWSADVAGRRPAVAESGRPPKRRARRSRPLRPTSRRAAPAVAGGDAEAATRTKRRSEP